MQQTKSQCSGIRDSTATDSGRGEGDKGNEEENSRILTSALTEK